MQGRKTMKNSLIVLVVMSAVLSSTPALSITIGPATQPGWEPQAQVKLGWIFGDPTNPQNTGAMSGWDKWVGSQPVWSYDGNRVDPWGGNPAQWYIRIPNLNNENPYKHFWMSYVYEHDNTYEDNRSFTNVDWFPFEDFAVISVQGEMFDSSGNPTNNVDLGVYGRMTVVYDMYPNPQYEDIYLGVAGTPFNDFKLLEVYIMTQCVAACDFDEDGSVNFRDIAVLALAWSTKLGDGGWNPACDLSDPNDGIIDYADLDVCVNNWLLDL